MKKKEKLKQSIDTELFPEPINLGKSMLNSNPNHNPIEGSDYVACKGCFCVQCYTYWEPNQNCFMRFCWSWNQCTRQITDLGKGVFVSH